MWWNNKLIYVSCDLQDPMIVLAGNVFLLMLALTEKFEYLREYEIGK